MTQKRFLSVAAALLLAATLPAINSCRKKAPATAAEARPPETAPPPATSVAPPSSATPPSIEADVLSQDLQTLNRKGYLRDAFFDYDKAELREDARAALSADAQWLKSYSSMRILIEGHCDERGTSEYNLALGDRRANAAKEYLASLGIAAARVQTVSYGKERPFCTESNEECWQQNRRAHFLITAK
jgi:peptidoglycan-associated lipoprotein